MTSNLHRNQAYIKPIKYSTVIITMLVSLMYFVVYSSIDITALLLITVLLMGVIPLRKLFGISYDPLDPSILLSLTYMFYGLGPLTISDWSNSELIEKYLLLILLGFISLKIGLAYGHNIKNKQKIAYDENGKTDNKRILLATTWCLFIASLISISSQLISFGGFQRFLQVGYGGERYLITQESVTFGGGFAWFLIATVLLWFYGLKYSSILSSLSGALLFIFANYILLLIGGRSTIVYCVMFACILYHFGYKKISGALIGIGLAAGVVFMQFYSLARFYLQDGLATAFLETYRNILVTPLVLAPFTSGEFTAPAYSLIEIIQNGGPNLQFGSSYVLAAGQLIPVFSRLTSSIFFDPSLWRLATYHPEILEIGGGLGFTPVAEGYINFGIPGIILHMFFYGAIISRIHTRMLYKRSISLLLLFAGSLPMFMLDGMRIHAASLVYKWTRVYLVSWFIFLIICTLSKNVSRMSWRK